MAGYLKGRRNRPSRTITPIALVRLDFVQECYHFLSRSITFCFSLIGMICVGILLALLAPFFGYTLASPIRPAPVARSRTGWGWNVEDLENEFKGLWWQEAFKAEECNDEQLDKIIFATRYAMKMMQKPGPEENIALSKAWTRYFGPYISWQQFGIDNHNQAAEIQSECYSVVRQYLCFSISFRVVLTLVPCQVT